jgi:hypothetical protein
MKTGDYYGFGALFLWGLWFVVFPGSVIKFYTQLHRGTVKMPREGGVRLAGGIWLFIVTAVLFDILHKTALIR